MCSLFEEIADKAALEGELDVSKTLQNLQPEARRHFVEMLCAWTSNIPVDNENCGKTYHDTTGTKLCMLLEFCNCGDIEEYMKKFEEPFTPEELRGIALMVVFALQAADDFCQFRHNDFKALNVLLHKFRTPERNAVFRYVVKGSELRFALPEGFEYCAKIGDFGFSVVGQAAGPSAVDVKYFTTLENTPPEGLFQGDKALTARGHDLWCLALFLLHLFSQRAPYEEILHDCSCPTALMEGLLSAFNHDDYSVIQKVMESVFGGDKTLRDTVYRYLVFFSDESIDVFKHSAVWRAINKWRKQEVREVEQFEEDRRLFSLETGEYVYIARAREQLQTMGGWDILLKLFSFNPANRLTPLQVLESDFMLPFRKIDDRSDASNSEPQSEVCRYHRMPTS